MHSNRLDLDERLTEYIEGCKERAKEMEDGACELTKGLADKQWWESDQTRENVRMAVVRWCGHAQVWRYVAADLSAILQESHEQNERDYDEQAAYYAKEEAF